jgi:hypothetical protein
MPLLVLQTLTKRQPTRRSANDQSLHHIAIDVMEPLWKLASLAKNAVLSALHFVCFGWWGWAAMTINALDLLATASVLTRRHARDQTKGSYLSFGWLVLVTTETLSEFLAHPQLHCKWTYAWVQLSAKGHSWRRKCTLHILIFLIRSTSALS